MHRMVLVLALVATPALADTKAPKPATKPAKVEEAPKPACKKRVVGKGLDRKVVCEFEQDIVVGASAPKPKVIIESANGRNVVGRPKLTDPLEGLSHRRD